MNSTLKAHAKVNLGLNIIAKRGDGFHEVDTLMARLELHDLLTLEPLENGIELKVLGADLPEDRTNLAYKAAESYLQAAGETRGVRIRLEKHIPIAAGLGGGSADAAAVLRGLAQLYPSDVDLHAIAKALGSDIAFFVADTPAARATGRGERLEPLPLPPLHLVLINPGIHVSAKEAYENLQNFSGRLELAGVLGRLERGEEPLYLNALQPGVLKLKPEILEVIMTLRDTDLRGVMMSGSGSTCFGLARDAAHAEAVGEALKQNHPHYWVRATRTV